MRRTTQQTSHCTQVITTSISCTLLRSVKAARPATAATGSHIHWSKGPQPPATAYKNGIQAEATHGAHKGTTGAGVQQAPAQFLGHEASPTKQEGRMHMYSCHEVHSTKSYHCCYRHQPATRFAKAQVWTTPATVSWLCPHAQSSHITTLPEKHPPCIPLGSTSSS
jgi:hypothetical protein